MRIGINALYVIANHNGGTETYLRELLNELLDLDSNNDYFLFVSSHSADSFSFKQRNIKIISCPMLGKVRGFRVVYEQMILPLLVKLYAIDVLHSPAFVAPMFLPCKSVVTIHDLYHFHFPKWISWQKRVYWKIMVPITIKKACRVLTVSHQIKGELLDHFRSAENKTVVTYEGVKYHQSKLGESLSGLGFSNLKEREYVLWVGTLARHKNVMTLLRAYHIFKRKSNSAHKLVLAGGIGETISGDFDNIRKYLFDNSLEDEVIMPGRVSDEQLQALYSNAFCFTFPSLYEGFGLPVLEAMSLGCPVIISNCGSLPEIAGDAAIVVDDALSPQKFADAMQRLFEDINIRKNLIKNGKVRSQKFSFQNTAKSTLKCYLEEPQAL